jgi:NAD(P)-dependent dehydrogenase (short-subunit alcohol dehydrogenase family)
MDLRDAAAVSAAVGQTVSSSGSLDIMVANAGIALNGSLVHADHLVHDSAGDLVGFTSAHCRERRQPVRPCAPARMRPTVWW